MILELHPSIKAMRGKTGQWVYKKVGNTVYAADKPKPSTKPPTPEQQEARDRFILSTNYAKAVMADPQSKALYEAAATAQGIPVFALARRDSLTRPRVMDIDLSAYNRQTGDTIAIRAVDDFEVTAVEVTIRNGQLVESGMVVKSNDGLGRWIYTATANAAAGELTIEAVATDRPGNKGTKTAVLQ